MRSPLRCFPLAVVCLFALTSLTNVSYSQNVTTWHNDTNRTGRQQNETILNTTNVTANAMATQTEVDVFDLCGQNCKQ